MIEIGNIEKKLSRTLNHASASGYQAMTRMSDAANQAAQTLVHKSDQLMHAQAQLSDGCRTNVKQQALTALGIAIAAGYWLGWAIHKRQVNQQIKAPCPEHTTGLPIQTPGIGGLLNGV